MLCLGEYLHFRLIIHNLFDPQPYQYINFEDIFFYFFHFSLFNSFKADLNIEKRLKLVCASEGGLNAIFLSDAQLDIRRKIP